MFLPFTSRDRGGCGSRQRWFQCLGSAESTSSQVLALHQAGAQHQVGRAGLGLERGPDVESLVRERGVAAGRGPHPLRLGAWRRLLPLGCKTQHGTQNL